MLIVDLVTNWSFFVRSETEADMRGTTVVGKATKKQTKMHRWARLLKTAIVDYRLSLVSVFRLQQTNESFHYPLVWFFIYIYIYIYIETSAYIYNVNGTIYICCCFKWKTEDQAIFLNPFFVCSWCKLEIYCLSVCWQRNWVICLHTDLTDLAHLCENGSIDREVYWAEARAMSQVWGEWGTSTTVYIIGKGMQMVRTIRPGLDWDSWEQEQRSSLEGQRHIQAGVLCETRRTATGG
jgi:hypothetical protein